MLLQINAVLFYFGFKPFKIFGQVPKKDILQYEDVESLLPEIFLRPGKFVHLKNIHENSETMAIFIYTFNEVIGCRNISDDFHGLLPPCDDVNKLTDTVLLSFRGEGKLGTSFYYTEDVDEPLISFEVNGNVNIQLRPSTSTMDADRSCENMRAERYRQRLSAHLDVHHKELKIVTKQVATSNLTLKMKKISPFTGEGDHLLIGIPLSTNLVVAGEEEEEGGVNSPPQQGEHRTCADYEFKDLTTQSNHKVEQQLKANMLLVNTEILTTQLKDLDENPITILKDLNTVVSYGISFGMVKPILVLKLIINFTNNELTYEKKYQSPRDLDKASRLACATEYLICRMKKQTPDP